MGGMRQGDLAHLTIGCPSQSTTTRVRLPEWWLPGAPSRWQPTPLAARTLVAPFPSKLRDESGADQLRRRPPCRWGLKGMALEQVLSDTFKLLQYLGISQCLAVRNLPPG